MRPAATLWIAAVLALAACGMQQPVKVLQREAAKLDREHARALKNQPDDGRYWVDRAEALAVARDAVGTFGRIGRIEADAVISDWSYSEERGVDTDGEWVRQTRTRVTARIVGGQELGLDLTQRSESRTLRAGSEATGWAGGDSTYLAPAAAVDLKAIEDAHLVRPHLDGDEAKFRRVAVEHSPGGYAITVDEPGRLVAERVITTARTGRKGDTSAAWHHRSRISLLIGDGGTVQLVATGEHRFDTHEGPGEYGPVGQGDDIEARAWVRALLADPRSGLVLGEPTRPMPAPVDGPLTEPPQVPRLRPLGEIQTQIANRALETRTGQFQLCLIGVVLPPWAPDGASWDLDPAADPDNPPRAPDDAVPLAVALGRTPPADPKVAPLRPLAGADRAIPIVKDTDAEAAYLDAVGKLGRLPGFNTLKLPANPDLAGHVDAGERAAIPDGTDRLTGTWDAPPCVQRAFKDDAPTVRIALWDRDEGAPNQEIASCELRLSEILRDGGGGIDCGPARAWVATTYRFDLKQIDVVGLPPVAR